MNTDLADVSVIIVNYNTLGLLRDCLNSLLGAEGKNCEVIVVDNGSADGSAAMVAREFPIVRLLRNPQNAGFARANNQGMSAANGRYMLLLNSDTIVRPGALSAMSEFLDSNMAAGAVACRLLNEDGTIQASVNDHLGPMLQLFRLLGVSRLVSGDRVRRWLGRAFGPLLGKTLRSYLIPYATDRLPVEVGGLSGACLLLRRQAVEEVGLLDEGFFMYLEDMDYCLRLRKSRWKLYYLPYGEIVHLVGGSSGGRMRNYNAQSYQSLFRFYRKHFSHRTSMTVRAMVLIAVGMRWAWNWMGSKLSDGPAYRQNERDLRQILRACVEPPR